MNHNPEKKFEIIWIKLHDFMRIPKYQMKKISKRQTLILLSRMWVHVPPAVCIFLYLLHQIDGIEQSKSGFQIQL